MRPTVGRIFRNHPQLVATGGVVIELVVGFRVDSHSWLLWLTDLILLSIAEHYVVLG